jgi:hypothetical protein
LVSGGILDIQFIPCVPAGALYRSPFNPTAGPSSAVFNVDGNAVWDYNLANGVGTYGSLVGWQMANIYPEYLPWAIAGEGGDSYPISPVPGQRARVVTMGWRILYVGQPVLASGYFTVASQPAKFDSSFGLNIEPVNLFSSGANTATPSQVYPPGQTYIRHLNMSTTPFGALTNQDTLRIDSGCCGVLRSDTSDLGYQANPREGYYAVQTFAPNQTTEASMIDTTSAVAYGNIKFWDDRFDPVTVRVTGMSANTSLVVETVLCVEYEVDPTNILSKIAPPAPRNNLPEVQKVGEFLRTEPLARPAKDEAMTVSRYMAFAKQATKIASYVPGPQAGAIAAIADMLGAL